MKYEIKFKQKKQAILIFYPHFKFLMGGTKFILELSKYLSNYYKIFYLINSNNYKPEKEFKKYGQIITLSKFTTNDPIYWLFFPFFAFYDLIKIIQSIKKIDEPIKLFIGALFPSNFYAFISSLIFKCNYFFLCYEPFPFFFNKDLIRKYSFFKRIFVFLLRYLYGFLDILSAKYARCVITLDEFKKKEIVKVYGVKPKIIGVGVDSLLFNPKKRILKTNHDKIFQEKVTFINSNDYTELKNLDIILKAFAIASKQTDNIHLFITSTQPESKRRFFYFNLVKKLKIDNKVTFLGLLNKEDLAKYYSKASCYISANNNNITAGDWPVKEALCSGTIAIRGEIGTPDVIDKETGFKIDITNPREIADKILWIERNRNIVKKMGIHARDFIIKNYPWKSVYKKFKNIIK